MKAHLLFLLALLGSYPLLPAQDKTALAEIVSAYEQIESGHKDWPHYSYRAENLEGGHAYERHVWKSEGDDTLTKVTAISYDEHGDSQTQYYLKGSELVFTLERTESIVMQPKAPTVVNERRYYHAQGRLIRALEKKGSFPAGTPADTGSLKNRELPLEELEDAAKIHRLLQQEATEIMARARLLDEEAPTQDRAPTSGDDWRLIAGSGSPDGRYALAWGIENQAQPEIETLEDGTLLTNLDADGLTNYVIELQSQKIIGQISGRHFGDRSTYNHLTTQTVWSEDSSFFAQVNSAKWNTRDAFVYELQWPGSGLAVSSGADLLDPSTDAAFGLLKGSLQLQKFTREDFAISLHDVRIVREGSDTILQTGIIGEVPKNEDEDSMFEFTLTFILTSAPSGAAPQLILSRGERH